MADQPLDLDRERQTRDRALAIVHDAECLLNLIETLPKRIDEMNNWRLTLVEIQRAYLELARACDRNLKGT